MTLSKALLTVLLSIGSYYAFSQGIEIDTILEEYSGVRIKYTGGDGMAIDEAERNGIRIRDAGATGLLIDSSRLSGVYIRHAGSIALRIDHGANKGVEIGRVRGNGLQINEAGGHGILVSRADRHSINIRGSKRGGASVENHIARISNDNSERGGDVLALKVNTIDPDHDSNFITFFEEGSETSTSTAIGAIEGNGSGGVTFKTSGADFAEALTQIFDHEAISQGDVVGVKAGKITLSTLDADRVLVVTDRPAIIGNHRADANDTCTQNVSLLGQVPVKIIGAVSTGDWIIPSGKADGLAFAKSSLEINLDDVIIGQAWETNLNAEEKLVNVIVGIDQTSALRSIISSLQSTIQDQDRKLINHEQSIADIQSKLEKITMAIDK